MGEELVWGKSWHRSINVPSHPDKTLNKTTTSNVGDSVSRVFLFLGVAFVIHLAILWTCSGPFISFRCTLARFGNRNAAWGDHWPVVGKLKLESRCIFTMPPTKGSWSSRWLRLRSMYGWWTKSTYLKNMPHAAEYPNSFAAMKLQRVDEVRYRILSWIYQEFPPFGS